ISRISSFQSAPEFLGTPKLGAFELPRSQQSALINVSSAELLQFIRDDDDGQVTLGIRRETTQSHDRGLVHAFASNQHPSRTGPVLEIHFKD
ncbi:MAG: iron dicitrate transport regulator FecR, partial [Verrucomicrobiota bacterium]